MHIPFLLLCALHVIKLGSAYGVVGREKVQRQRTRLIVHGTGEQLATQMSRRAGRYYKDLNNSNRVEGSFDTSSNHGSKLSVLFFQILEGDF